MSIWDITTPAGSDSANQGDDRIREMKEAIQESLRGSESDGTVAKFPGANPSTAPTYHYRGYRGGTGSRPTAGDNGLFIDTTRNAVQRDNGSSWDDIATLIPAGTVMLFFQAAAPTGWTKIVTQNDKVLRVVSGSGGGAGGTIATSTTLAHTHTMNSHTHTWAGTTSGPSGLTTGISGGGSGIAADGTHTHTNSGTTGGTIASMDSQLAGALAYIDVICASKD